MVLPNPAWPFLANLVSHRDRIRRMQYGEQKWRNFAPTTERKSMCLTGMQRCHLSHFVELVLLVMLFREGRNSLFGNAIMWVSLRASCGLRVANRTTIRRSLPWDADHRIAVCGFARRGQATRWVVVRCTRAHLKEPRIGLAVLVEVGRCNIRRLGRRLQTCSQVSDP